MSDTNQTTTCPNCGRNVERGFRFCDSCGQKLELDSATPTPTLAPEKVDLPKQPEWHTPIEDTSKQAPLLERLRQRRETGKEDDHEEFKPPKMDEPPTGPIAIPAPPAPEPKRDSAPTRELTPARSSVAVEAPKTTPAWRPIVPESPRFTPRVAIIWLIHVLLAFGGGLLLLLVAAAIASMLSNGRTALLELRGLPIFLAGATSVIVFTLLRTGRVRLSSSRRVTAITVVIGFVLLVAGSAIAYRPAPMHSAQMKLDRTLHVYGPSEKQAVDGFEADVSDWNTEVAHYRGDILAPVLSTKPDVTKFRFDASASEETMKGIVDRMGTHALTANNVRMRDALTGLESIYEDELSGINLLTRGVLSGDQALIAQGDTRYKDGNKRAIEFFNLRMKPLLERAGLDVTSFQNTVTG